MRTCAALLVAAIVTCASAPAVAGEAAAKEVVALDTGSLWRCRFIKGTELIRLKSGELVHAIESPAWQWVKVKGKRVRKIQVAPKRRRRPLPPPPEWTGVDFDDGTWELYRGPFSGSGSRTHRSTKLCPRTRLIFLRGTFRVDDPAEVKSLILSASFEGGLVAYLNGGEVARSHLPEGAIDAQTVAADYPRDVYVCPKGAVLTYRDEHRLPDRFKQRVRTLPAVALPTSALRKGVNVLAVSLRHAPGAEVMYTGPMGAGGQKGMLWPRVGLEELRLVAVPGAGVVPNAARPVPPKGLRVWNHPVVRTLAVSDCGDLFGRLRPVRIVGVRGGVFSGQVVVSFDRPIKGMRAEATALTRAGGAVIPSTAVEIRYGLPDGTRRSPYVPPTFDTLASQPPAEVAVHKTTARDGTVTVHGAVLPIWITVHVKADAAPGDYEGSVAVRADGQPPVRVPVKLHVAEWSLPEPRRFTTFMGFAQSPDTLAAKYKVAMWSERHWKLIDQSFRLLAQIGCKTLYIPLVAKTHFGNAHSMVRWIKAPGATYKHDFSIVEKYVATAAGHLGHIPVVCAYCWEPEKVGSHYDHNTFHGERQILLSVLDPETGQLSLAKGPRWGTPACREFWKPVMAGLKAVLKKRGLDRSMMLGLCNDFEPSKGAAEDLAAAAPGVPWVVHSHTGGWLGRGVRGQRVAYLANVWGMSGASDPDVPYVWSKQRRFYGWKYPVLLTRFGRNDFWQSSPVSFYRAYPEGWIVARGKYRGGGAKGFCGADGVGRMGADFWPLFKDKRGRWRGSLAGYYSPWGGLDLGRFGVTYVLGPGKDGPVRTVRFEMFRECLQENEARIFLEKILTDPARRAKLGEALATRAQDILDERVRAFLDFDIEYQGVRDARWFVCSGWQDRSARLYAAAAEVAKALAQIKGE